MTIEELTFAAFQQGREQGREESAAEIERLREVLRGFVEPFKNYPDSVLKDDAKAFPNQALLLRARAALQPKEE